MCGVQTQRQSGGVCVCACEDRVGVGDNGRRVVEWPSGRVSRVGRKARSKFLAESIRCRVDYCLSCVLETFRGVRGVCGVLNVLSVITNVGYPGGRDSGWHPSRGRGAKSEKGRRNVGSWPLETGFGGDDERNEREREETKHEREESRTKEDGRQTMIEESMRRRVE